MNPHKPPRLTYGLASGARLTVELTTSATNDLRTIMDTLQRESDAPTVPVSKSVAVRRALDVYAASLLRQTEGSLLDESNRASSNTYIARRK